MSGAASVVITSATVGNSEADTIDLVSSSTPLPTVVRAPHLALQTHSEDPDVEFTRNGVPQESPAKLEDNSNSSSVTVEEQSEDEEADRPHPALYARIAALGASLGYLALLIVKGAGLLKELAPKSSLGAFIKAPEKLQKNSLGRDREARTRRARQGIRLCCPTREPLRLIPPQCAEVASSRSDSVEVPALPEKLHYASQATSVDNI
eukprot:CAMPEP_0169076448 /NCGR_PEP_ID=MMETSP1015-20121227/8355_1 /TAXON_ID=342587 /ORGANISM="Karlodinium micrum, Strain CCMP2283" /LENGTH=206 /DNA_ID=CAMNT_0009135915 /DNA_START=239 /DNA_END=859 /DNA_ORIENTATION=-